MRECSCCGPPWPTGRGERVRVREKKMWRGWRWQCPAGVLLALQIVLLWRWRNIASSSAFIPPSVVDWQAQQRLSVECRAALAALQASSTRGELFYRMAAARVM